MSNVVEFKRPEKADPHLSGEAKCIGCQREWVTVAPVGTITLECPSCHAMRGVWRYPVGAAEGDFAFRCNCGCEALTAYKCGRLFYIKCMCCGTDQTQAIFG